MPPKPKPDKKQANKKADKLIEDKTFGLKNKNKSKKVQQYVTQVSSQAKHMVGLKHQTEAEKAAQAKAKKDAKDKEDLELRMLFSQLQSGAGKKAKVMEAAEEAAKAKREEEMDKDGKREWIEQDMTGKALEEVIEYERAKLAFHGGAKTPITEESFAQWKRDKAERIKRENAAKVLKELAKKTKGKGLSVLSGKALFEFDASLFVDDEDAGIDKLDVLRGLMEEASESGGEEDGERENGVEVQEGLYMEGEEDLSDLEVGSDSEEERREHGEEEDEEEDEEEEEEEEEEGTQGRREGRGPVREVWGEDGGGKVGPG